MLLSDASPLMPGLSFALFTQSMHFAPQALVRDGPVPVGVELQKYYFKPDIDALQEQANEARSFGAAAAEEWYKGLPARGQQAQNDAARFEQWELNRGLANARSALFKLNANIQRGENMAQHAPLLPSRPPVTVAPLTVEDPRILMPTTLPPLRQYGIPPGLETSYNMPSMQSDSASMGSQKSAGGDRALKGSRERARIRSHKKQDIIARCSKLSPPISREMLERMDTFDAALQVPMLLNDSSWETLKGRLLQQRHKIVLEDEAKSAARIAPIPGQFRPPSRTDDFMLAHANTSKRDKLGQIAEEFIKQKYGHGGWVTFPTSPQFAADVLVHTRQRFIEEEARVRSLQEQTGTITFEENLKLEDMKWVFEQNVKPRTEQIRKDLFLCPECPVQGTVKYFAFESIIQHYASKHTTEQKVSWKWDWPETPPFNAHPERVHTPTPSITHTPTLSHPPLSAMSPGSVLSSTIQSARWRSPDTMSLMSGTTNTFSVAGSSTSRHAVAASAPGYGMYEVQQDVISTELLRGWRMIPSTLCMSNSLRLHVAIAAASTKFNTKYRNQPSLELFADCVNKVELRELQDIGDLRCAECLVTNSPHCGATWSLQDLITHFRGAHVDHNPSISKPNWRNDMVALPEPAIIKHLQAVSTLVDGLTELLQDAITTSTLKSVQTTIPVLDLTSRNRAPPPGTNSRSIMRPQHDYRDPPVRDLRPARIDDYHASYHSQPPRRVVSSVAATYGEGASARDSWSATSGTIGDGGLSERSFRTRLSIETYDQRSHLQGPMSPTQPVEAGMHVREQGLDVSHARGEAMSRSETVRSYHSRGAHHSASIADDFLSTIDAHVDVEMAESSPGQAKSARTSGPVSRSSSAIRTGTNSTRRDIDDRGAAAVSRPSFSRLEHAIAPTHEVGLSRGYDHRGFEGPFPHDARDAHTDAMERQPSNVVEFDHNGTPVAQSGLVYHETSPPQRAVTRSRLNAYGRAVEDLAYTRAPQLALREAPTEQIRYAEDRAMSDYPYQAVEYVSAPSNRPERIYDAATGQYYVAERPSMQLYVQVDDGRHRVHTLYDERGRMVQYREVGSGPARREESGYERYPPEFEERRYQER